MRIRIVFLLLLLMLAGCDKAKESYKESYEKGFKESFCRNFVSSCIAAATGKGMQKTQAENKCGCIATFLVDRYSSSELTAISKNSPENKKIIETATSSCR